MHNSANKWLCDILLNEHSFVHSEWVVIHSPPARLFCLVREHRNAFGLGVVCKGTQKCDEAEDGLRDHYVRVFASSLNVVKHCLLGIADERFGRFGYETVMRLFNAYVFKYLLFQIPVNRSLSAHDVFDVVGAELRVWVSLFVVVHDDHRNEDATEIRIYLQLALGVHVYSEMTPFVRFRSAFVAHEVGDFEDVV